MPFEDEPTVYEALQEREPPPEVDQWARQVLGAAIEVHRHLGPGHLEGSYEEALAIEFDLRKIPYRRQVEVPLMYKGRPVGKGKIDFLVADVLVVEIKAIDRFAPVHKAQIIAYLAATNLQLGLLINYNVATLKEGIQRIIRS